MVITAEKEGKLQQQTQKVQQMEAFGLDGRYLADLRKMKMEDPIIWMMVQKRQKQKSKQKKKRRRKQNKKLDFIIAVCYTDNTL